MKKLLLCTAAVALGLALSTPAKAAADGIKLGIGGDFKGYMVWDHQKTDVDLPGPVTSKARGLDIVRATEIHFNGETTLDNGLTVGVYHEAEIDGGNNVDNFGNDVWAGSFLTRESYAYFSGGWGRFNFGKEDGSNYLLQVAAPSADSNLDGIRSSINPVNYALTDLDGLNTKTYNVAFRYASDGLDYDNSLTGDYNKLTYLTPVFSGFQFGVSYTPDVNDFQGDFFTQNGNPLNGGGLGGVHQNNQDNSWGSAWEGSGRYEGHFQNVSITAGAGYTDVALERNTHVGFANWKEWNAGVNAGWEAFNFGGVYTTDNGGAQGSSDSGSKTWVVGVDYTTGPYKLGGSYLHKDIHLNSTVNDLTTTRWAGGLVYTYGPGMTFRGSASFVKNQTTAGIGGDGTATDILVGTQINF